MLESFREELLDVFYKVVGSDVEEKEGEPRRLSETGEEYVELGCRFKKWEFPKVLQLFKEAVRGYKDSSRLTFNGKLRDINDNGNLKVYWRSKPEIQLRNEDCSFYTRFLFTYQEKVG